jgi:hypothetical protein
MALAVTHLLVASVLAQAQDDSAVTYTADQLHRHFQNAADAYVIRSGKTRLKLRDQPLMHWQNTVRQQEQGALYLWAKQGRPQVLGSIFTYEFDGQVHCRHEMISLAETPLTAELDSTPVWSPKQAGVNWILCDTVAPPTESAARRMTQMRAIARQLSGTLKLAERNTANLTLIPQPLVRYQAPDAGVIDGAIFSMAVVTDPEIFLLVEAQKSDGGPAAWHFAAARSHFHQLELRRGGQIVWQAPDVAELANTRFGQFPWANRPYFIFFPPQPLPAPEELR